MKGGGTEGKGLRQQKRQKRKDNKSDDNQKKKKKANQAVDRSDSDNGDTESDGSDSAYLAVRSEPKLMWILDGGSTVHICKSRSAFTSFTPISDTIGG